jgi:hypothetical protein
MNNNELTSRYNLFIKGYTAIGKGGVVENNCIIICNSTLRNVVRRLRIKS